MRKSIKGLEERIEELDGKRGGRREEDGIEEKEKEGEMGGRLRKIEMKEREDKKKNILIRGIEVKDGKRREAVEEIFKLLEIKADIREIKGLGGEMGKGKKMLLIKLGCEEQRKEIWEKKNRLKGRKERILEDWSWKERRMRWLEEIARKKEREGKRVWIGYGKIRIDDQW